MSVTYNLLYDFVYMLPCEGAWGKILSRCTETRKDHNYYWWFPSLSSRPIYNQHHITATPHHGATCTTRARQCGVSCQSLLYCGQWGFLSVVVDLSTWDQPLPDVGRWWYKDRHRAAITDLCSQCRGLYMSSQLHWAVCQHFHCCSAQSFEIYTYFVSQWSLRWVPALICNRCWSSSIIVRFVMFLLL